MRKKNILSILLLFFIVPVFTFGGQAGESENPSAWKTLANAFKGKLVEFFYDMDSPDKFIPCPLLSNMVAAGFLGHKSGKGFYEYPKK